MKYNPGSPVGGMDLCVWKSIIRHQNTAQLFVILTEIIDLMTLERNPCSNCFLFSHDVLELNSRNTVLSKLIHKECMLTCTVSDWLCWTKSNFVFIYFFLFSSAHCVIFALPPVVRVSWAAFFPHRANVCVNPASGLNESCLCVLYSSNNVCGRSLYLKVLFDVIKLHFFSANFRQWIPDPKCILTLRENHLTNLKEREKTEEKHLC